MRERKEHNKVRHECFLATDREKYWLCTLCSKVKSLNNSEFVVTLRVIL